MVQIDRDHGGDGDVDWKHAAAAYRATDNAYTMQDSLNNRI
jgi:hypothetical protein